MPDFFKNAPIAKEWKRSTFPIRPKEVTNFTSFNLGELVPLYEPIEVLPHDTFVFDLSSLIRMPDAIQAPIMDGIDFDAYAFFVPKRLVWKYTKEFYGQNESPGARVVEYTEPRIALGALSKQYGYYTDSVTTEAIYGHRVSSHFGIPYCTFLGNGVNNNYSFVNILPLRAYFMIWNYYFRDQNLQTAYSISTDGNGDSYQMNSLCRVVDESQDPNFSGNTQFSYGISSALLKAAKKHDYFTSLLPYAEKTSSDIVLPLGTTAPLVSTGNFVLSSDNSSGSTLGQNVVFGNETGTADSAPLALGTDGATLSYSSGLQVDLSSATSSAINVLREALALHRLYEIDAIGGTRYDEQIFAHFGARPIAETFKPEELGEVHFSINVDQVVAHAGNDSESLGTTGAYSVTGNKSHFVTKSFTEPGYIILLGVARQSMHIYSQGLSPLWSKHQRFDYFYPEFQNMGLVPKYKREIMALGSSADANTFGFGDYGEEYRIFKPMVTGMLNPNRSGSLDYWTLADELSTSVSLSSSFIAEDDSNLTRALVTGSSSDQFVGRFALRGTMTRVVPVHSLPRGLN